MATAADVSAGGGAEDRVVATAQKILKSLNTPKSVTDDMVLIFSSFDKRLSHISSDAVSHSDGSSNGARKDTTRFETAEKIIRKWDQSLDCLPWDDSPDEAWEYLTAVEEVIRSMEDGLDSSVTEHAESLLQLGMNKLEDEFRSILIRNTVPLDSERLYGSIRRLSISFCEGGEIGRDEFVSFVEDQESRSSVYHERSSTLGESFNVELIGQDAIGQLKEIADLMIRSGYEKECCNVYTSVRCDVLDECLMVIGFERLSIEEVQRMEWKGLDEKMKKWVQAVKVVMRALLSAEKDVCEQVFDGNEAIIGSCFSEVSKGCVMQLLNFGEAVAIGRKSPEKLFRILDMYDALNDVLPNLEAFFPDEEDPSRDFICGEARQVLAALGETSKGTLVEFEKAVQGETSKKPVQGAEVHPLTRYVMNYVKLLVDYKDTLNSLLMGCIEDDHLVTLPSADADELEVGDMSPIGRRLLLLIASLESNLVEKSTVYDDSAMQNIFLMNNIRYMVQKVKDSELGNLLGENWVRRHRGQTKQYASGYFRTCWTRVLSALKDTEWSSGSLNSVNKTILKERFKHFNTSFEDLYRIQTAWKVPDTQLREDLRIMISGSVILAYRAFLGRYQGHIEGGRHSAKYLKYTAEELENYLLDLFEGTPRDLLHPKRRNG